MATTRRVTIIGFPGLQRSTDQRVVAGVCGGIGEHFGVDPVIVRLAAVVLTLVSGIGVVVYALAWAFLPEASGDRVIVERSPRVALGRERAIAVGFLTVGSLLLLRAVGLWFPDRIIWPVSLAAVGLALVWARTDGRRRGTDRVEDALAQTTPVRVVAGSALLLAGLAAFIAGNDSLATLGYIGIAVLVTALGAALLAGPWVLRLWRQLTDERRERIRQEERAEMAAHLHDSVLQTLALIQRRSGSPQEMTRLARRQERELRAWLYGDRDATRTASLAAALEAIADDVEADHTVVVEVVTAGDCDLDDDRLRALVEAAREAVVNAAKHAGVPEILVFAEIEADHVAVYVRDRGAGFDLDAVDGDRRGIADSIVARMHRHGGVAAVLSEPGLGTEIVLEMKL